jgi:hypothetical protein
MAPAGSLPTPFGITVGHRRTDFPQHGYLDKRRIEARICQPDGIGWDKR